MTSACACSRLSASPRSTSRTSSRFFAHALRGPDGQPVDELARAPTCRRRSRRGARARGAPRPRRRRARRPRRARPRSRRRRACRPPTWKRRPSSSPNARHGACSPAGTPAAQSPSPTEAAKSRPVFSRCSSARSTSASVMSRYWPPIIPSVASTSSRATSGASYESASRSASASSASPASSATPSPNATCALGRPRRSSSSSIAGRSSWTSENVWTSSSATAAGSASSAAAAGRLGGREAEHRPDPLAAAVERVAHRLVESAGERRRRASRSRELLLDERRGARQAARIGGLAGALHLGLDLLRELGELGETVDRRVDVARLRRAARLELVHARRAGARAAPRRAASASSDAAHVGHRAPFAIRPRIPFTSRAASSVA